MNALARYDAARTALAEAHRIDEVKDIRDKAIALEAYARQAKDTSLIRHATEIRLRAERRAGELLAKIPKAKGGQPYQNPTPSRPQAVGAEVAKPMTLAEMGVTDTQSVKWQRLAALSEDKFETRVEHAKARVTDMTTSSPSYSKAIFTGENEWYTPAEYVERAREVLGTIDLDPASNEIAQEWIKAVTFFTIADDGLTREWFGRVWLNPPYARATMEPFVEKLQSEYLAGRVTEAVLLTHNYTDTGWFHTAAISASAICLLRGRVRFVAPSGEECSPTQGQVFFYFGADSRRFQESFSQIGLIVRPA